MAASSITPWAWSDSEGANRVWDEMEQTGFSLFNDPTVLGKIAAPIAFVGLTLMGAPIICNSLVKREKYSIQHFFLLLDEIRSGLIVHVNWLTSIKNIRS